MNIFKQLIQRASRRALVQMAGDPDYQFISQNTIFRELSSAAQLFLFTRIIERRYARRELIFREENPGVCMFLIKQGSVELFLEHESGTTNSLRVLNAGDLFGEVAVASGNDRTASARAIRNDTILLSVSKFDLEDLNKQHPSDGLKVLRGITDSVIDSLIATTDQLKVSEATVLELQTRLADDEKQ